ncbi:hypothetical protein R84B8_02001 [Treponema sp. R8-4-B8]
MDKLENNTNRITDPLTWILFLCFGVSLFSLIIYLLDFNYSDKTLFLLLSVIRYSSSMLFICAFYKVLLNIYRTIRDHKFHLLKLLLNLVLMAYSIVIIFMDEFINTFSGGNL